MKYTIGEPAGRTIFVFLLLVLLVWAPTNLLSAGYQEEKLFDGDFYTAEELRKKVEAHTRQIKVLSEQIKALETDIDWLVLKINEIEDSGRRADETLKASIAKKEKKAATLRKTKERLQYLVQFYTESSQTNPEKSLAQIVRERKPVRKAPEAQAGIQVKPLTPAACTTTASAGVKGDLDPYDGVSRKELQKAVNEAGLSDWVEIVGTGSCLRLETTLPILFPTGSAKIAAEYKSFFQKLSAFLKPYDVKVFVSGYADKTPIQNKKYPSNFELGATRAANIVHQMVGHGLKPSIFRIESTGRYRFAAKQKSKQKTLERRAEVTVIFSG